jgi:lipoprotein-anchoring transpeptidase ErfK/SrfK
MNNSSLHAWIASTASGCLRLGLAAVAAVALCQCSGTTLKAPADVVVSVKEQKLAIYNRGGEVSKAYPVSTSKFGLSDKPGTYGTPLGLHEVVAKIGHGAPSGAVFKSRNWTGEIIKPDSPGRDPIVSRIMWLRGMEKTNKNAYARCIYIHGTAEERNVGKPVSYGCIRMRSRDVIDLFGRLPVGSRVLVTRDALPDHVPVLPAAVPVKADPSTQPPIFLKPPSESGENAMLAKNDIQNDNDAGAAPSNSAEKREGFLAKMGLKSRSAPEPEPEADLEREKGNRWAFVSKIIPKKSEPVPPGLPTLPEQRRRQPAPEPEPEPETQPVAYRYRPVDPQPVLPPAPKVLPGGGAVLYSAPSTTGGPGLVLKSKRTANQGYQN